MTKITTILLVVFVLFACAIADQNFYVATNGNDKWSGTLVEPNAMQSDGPFATIQKARDTVRGLSKSEPINIFIREGVYFLGETLLLEENDSGRVGNPIIYQSYEGETATLSGGIELSDWEQEGTLFVTIIDEVINDDLYFKELFVNDGRRDRARNPNKGDFFRINGGVKENRKGAFRYHAGDIEQYGNLDDVNIVMYQSWLAVHLWIDDIDQTQQIVTYSPNMVWEIGYFENNQRYYVENAYEFLDAPGEWYLDRHTGKLSYYPMPGETIDGFTAIVPVTDKVLQLGGNPAAGIYVHDLTFNGLEFKHANWTLDAKGDVEGQAHTQVDDAIIFAHGATNCSFEKCEIALGGGHGMYFTLGCQDNRVEQCQVRTLGGGGIYFADYTGWNSCRVYDDSEKIIFNTVDNCFIHDLTNVHHGSVGVLVGCASDHTITHNEICNTDYTGISVGWCWGYDDTDGQNNIITHNHIHHLGQGEMSDMGGVYTLGIAEGTVVSNNLIHDVYSYVYGGWGLYPDQASSDLVFENNIVYNTKSGAFHLHFGQDIMVRNNILAMAGEQEVQRGKNEDGHSMFFEKNIIYSQTGSAIGGEWSDENFTMDNNLYWNSNGSAHLDATGELFASWQSRGHDVNSVFADPKFVDPGNYNFNLQGDSPAFDLGFQPINVSEIGLYGDPTWVELANSIEPRSVNSVAKSPEFWFFNMDEFFDDFEDTPVGSFPQAAHIWGITGHTTQNISVSNEQAMTGSHSLKIQDDELEWNTYEPFMYYMPNWYESGTVTLEFDIYQEAGAKITHEWRSKDGYPDGVGPSVVLSPGATWKVGKEKFKVPEQEWYHFKIVVPVGEAANGTYDVSLTVGGVTLTKENKTYSKKTWNALHEAYFISGGNSKVAAFLDNMKFSYAKNPSLVEEKSEQTPNIYSYNLEQNYPNPFNPKTSISYTLKQNEHVGLSVFNIKGQKVAELVNGIKPRGTHSVSFDATHLASGLYWYRIDTPNYTNVKKMMIIK